VTPVLIDPDQVTACLSVFLTITVGLVSPQLFCAPRGPGRLTPVAGVGQLCPGRTAEVWCLFRAMRRLGTRAGWERAGPQSKWI
jgi:hypothetical protein